jgi:hypothetical protein
MAENFLRQSQVVTSFGPGAMLDLPDRSVMVGGLNMWSTDTSGDGWRLVSEPRLTAYLENKLGIANLQLRTPPEHDQSRRFGIGPNVGTVVFPLWFVCDKGTTTPDGRRLRRLVRWNDLESPARKVFRDEGKPQPVTPIRYVAACDRGHIQDIDWKWVVHRGERCVGRPVYLEERGTSGDTRDTVAICDCGRRFALSEAYIPPRGKGAGPLGPCHGHRPWLGERHNEACNLPLKLLTRTATNAYFSQSLPVISIPYEQDRLTQIVTRHHDVLRKAPTAAIIAIYREANPALAADLAGFADAEVFASVASLNNSRARATGASPKDAEFEVMTSGRRVIGIDSPGALLHAQTLDRRQWDTARQYPGLRSLVAVHRLREVICQFGFTRFEAPALLVDGGVEEQDLDIDMAAIADPIQWLPAIEQFGEGLMIEFDPGAVQTWVEREDVRTRSGQLAVGHKLWAAQRFAEGKRPAFRGAPYYLAHAFSHALMSEVALECGYPQSSLKERIYALERGLGVLIYTAAGDAEGTLGGLVALAGRLDELIERALDRCRLCSNDPICSDHDPALAHDDRHLQGAACHGCLLVPETSCESRNDFLDRALLVPGLSSAGAPFFGP